MPATIIEYSLLTEISMMWRVRLIVIASSWVHLHPMPAAISVGVSGPLSVWVISSVVEQIETGGDRRDMVFPDRSSFDQRRLQMDVTLSTSFFPPQFNCMVPGSILVGGGGRKGPVGCVSPCHPTASPELK